MLQALRVLKIQSDLESIAFRRDVVFTVEIDTRAERGDKLRDQDGFVSVFFEFKIEFAIKQSEDAEEFLGDPEIIGDSILSAQCLFVDPKAPEESWEEDELGEFARSSIPEIYPHMYQKLQQVFEVHGAGFPMLPLSFDPERFGFSSPEEG